MTEQSTPIAPNPKGFTTGVRKTIATQSLDATKCEIAIHIGVFFDGTGNARDGNGNTNAKWRHVERRKHTNVARLFDAYPDDSMEGYFPVYVPGLGTPFPQIGENEPAGFGDAGGEGGDGRINYGLLYLFNAVHQAISPTQQLLILPDTVKALCNNGLRGERSDEFGNTYKTGLSEASDEAALKRVDMDQIGGLLMSWTGARAHAETFYKKQAARLENRISNLVVKPKLKEIFIDVFGFSRGAAQARTFCAWLDRIFVGNRLFGVVTHIRFLGIFDSVASVGLNASARLYGQGHGAWADDANLRIGPRVKHCEHLVAMHENRPSFPLEFAEFKGAKPANCRQFAYPGMHSDVGGGYAPGEQGRWLNSDDFGGGQAADFSANLKLELAAVGNPHFAKLSLNELDSHKISQIPLNHMHDAACAAGVPLRKSLARGQGAVAYDPFTIHPATQRAFDEFMALGEGAKPLREWLLPYLAWRYQVRERYGRLVTTSRATASDQDDLRGANETLLRDIAALEAAQGKGISNYVYAAANEQRLEHLAPEAGKVLKRIKALTPVAEAAARMFMFLCHDSYAGFRPFDGFKIKGFDPIPGSWELEGYLRYRRRYEGDSRQLTRLEPAAKASESVA